MPMECVGGSVATEVKLLSTASEARRGVVLSRLRQEIQTVKLRLNTMLWGVLFGRMSEPATSGLEMHQLKCCGSRFEALHKQPDSRTRLALGGDFRGDISLVDQN